MSRTATYDAIVLRTVNVGEADRLCIFFTREVGRIAARAYGVRKSGSKSGGSLLPFRHVSVDLYVRDAGATVRHVQEKPDMHPPKDFSAFLCLERSIEMVLALTEDGHPLPELFDALGEYIRLSHDHAVEGFDAFRLRMLHVLGLLPSTADDPRFQFLPADAQAFVKACCLPTCNLQALVESYAAPESIEGFIRSVTEGSLDRPLRSDPIALGLAH